MHLEPRRTVRLASPFNGTVKSVLAKPSQHIDSATEVVRMDLTEKQFLLDRAKRESSPTGNPTIELCHGKVRRLDRQAALRVRLQAAKADLDLASFWVEQGSLRSPFPGEVFRISVAEGQVVRLGDSLATLGDTTSLTAEVPVDRGTTRVGESLSLKVEDRAVNAKVEALLPLSQQFEPLRDLLPSAALATVVIANADGQWKAGQTVY